MGGVVLMMDTGIANRLRAAGLRVIETAGWQTYGSSSFNPGGSVNHHTAGPASGETPSLVTCIEGRPDLPGPLCNVYQSRESDGRDIAYVIAAGRANHAGEGGWRGLSGNASVYGLEVEHTGVDPIPSARLDIAARIHAAMFGGDVANVCQHREWTDRKIDMATNVNGDDFRRRVADARKPPPPPKTEEVPMAAFTAMSTEGNTWLFEDERYTLIPNADLDNVKGFPAITEKATADLWNRLTYKRERVQTVPS